MSHLLRRPGAVPALFSPTADPLPETGRGARASRLRDASGLVILPFLVLAAELPLARGAAVLRLALPH